MVADGVARGGSGEGGAGVRERKDGWVERDAQDYAKTFWHRWTYA